jgi:hypothetical protein
MALAVPYLSAEKKGEAANLFNHANFGNPSSTLGSSGFNTIRSLAGDPRLMQMVFRFTF